MSHQDADEDYLRPEYDFSDGLRGKYAARFSVPAGKPAPAWLQDAIRSDEQAWTEESRRRSQELVEELAGLATVDEDALWRAARQCIPLEASTRLEALHFKRQDEGWTESEEKLAAELVRQYELNMLLRVRATLLLKQRGHDISVLFTKR